MKKFFKLLTVFIFALMIISDVILLGMMGFGIIGSFVFNDFEELPLFLTMSVMPVLYLPTSIVSLIRYLKGEKHMIIRSLLMKGTIFMLMLAFSLISYQDGIYGMIVCLFFSIVLIGLSFLAGKHGRKLIAESRKKNGETQRNVLPKFEEYNAAKYWNSAALEYLLYYDRDLSDLETTGLKSKEPSDMAECLDRDYKGLSLVDKNRIAQYSSMPVIYLLRWLIENGYMSDSFRESHAETYEKAQSGEISAVDFFAGDMGYILRREDIRDDMTDFIDKYFGAFYNTRIFDRKCRYFFFDYCETVQSRGARYFCADYSNEAYNELSQRIVQRYAEYTERSSLTIHEQSESSENVFWHRFDANLDVYTFGEADADYIKSCETTLNGLSDCQLNKLSRMIKRCWSIDDERDPMKEIRPLCIYVNEPRGDDVHFSIGCGADFEQEHGFGFTVRNGIIINIGYDNDFYIPYIEDENEIYELEKNCMNFVSLTKKEQAESECAAGRLAAVPVTLDFMTPLDDMSALSRTIYITPAAEKLYKQNIKYLRILGNCGAITDVNISCQKYGESIVPQTILFKATANNSESKGSKERLLYFDVLRVWN